REAVRRRTEAASHVSQREVLRDVMMSAGSCGTWLTLREMAAVTRFGEASISAQLRHLRKRENGGYVITRRLRERGEGHRTPTEPLWEYRLIRRRSGRGDAASAARTLQLLRDAIKAAHAMDRQRDLADRRGRQFRTANASAAITTPAAHESVAISCSSPLP